MLSHDGRRRLLYNAVTLLEPDASAALIQHYVVRRYDLTLPLLRTTSILNALSAPVR